MNKLNNTVIEVLTDAHGQKVKKLFERNGMTSDWWSFDSTKARNGSWRFYGYRYGRFNNYTEGEVETFNLKVLTLEEATKLLEGEPEFIFNI